jgi:hypothetical protein
VFNGEAPACEVEESLILRASLLKWPRFTYEVVLAFGTATLEIELKLIISYLIFTMSNPEENDVTAALYLELKNKGPKLVEKIRYVVP